MSQSALKTTIVNQRAIVALCISHVLYFLPIVAEFRFSQSSYNVSEDSGEVNVCLELISGVLTNYVVIEVMIYGGEEMSGCKSLFSLVAPLKKVKISLTNIHSWKRYWECYWKCCWKHI